MLKKIPQNAFWNLVSLGSGILVSIAIPPFLTRTLTAQEFGAWSLVLQVAGYVNILSFGMQTVVARHVAILHGAHAPGSRSEIVSTAFWILVGAASLGVCVLVVGAMHFGAIFPALPPALRDQGATAAMLVGTSLALALPFHALAGVFIGMQRNEIPAMAAALSRALLCVGVVVVAIQTQDLVWMAVAYAVATAAGAWLQWGLWRRLTEQATIAVAHVTRRAGRVLRGECIGLSVWSLAMLLISGLHLVIVARVDYAMVPYFAVAASLTLFLVGILQALSASILPVAAQYTARRDAEGLSRLLATATRFCAVASLLAATPLIAFGWLVLSWWVGAAYADKASNILAILTVAYCVRMSALPYVTAAVGAGLQQRMIMTPLVEGVVTAGAATALGVLWGAVGVAMGTLVGSAVGLLALLIHHPLRDELGGQGMAAYLKSSTLRGAALLALLVVVAIAVPEAARRSLGSLLVGFGIALIVCWLVGLESADRALLVRMVRTRRLKSP